MRQPAVFFIAGVVVLLAAFGVASILPSASLCVSIRCGSGGVQAFDHSGLTWPQALTILLGLVTALPLIVMGWIARTRRRR